MFFLERLNSLGTDLRRSCGISVDGGDWAEEKNLDNSPPTRKAPNVAPRDSATALQRSILTLGFNLLLTAGVVCVKDAQGSESEREGGDFANLSRGYKSVEAGVLQVYFCESRCLCCLRGSYTCKCFTSPFEISHTNSCILTNRSRQTRHICALISSR